eukprot:353561-Chlamydomonas_euryale.AAC.1
MLALALPAPACYVVASSPGSVASDAVVVAAAAQQLPALDTALADLAATPPADVAAALTPEFAAAFGVSALAVALPEPAPPPPAPAQGDGSSGLSGAGVIVLAAVLPTAAVLAAAGAVWVVRARSQRAAALTALMAPEGLVDGDGNEDDGPPRTSVVSSSGGVLAGARPGAGGAMEVSASSPVAGPLPMAVPPSPPTQGVAATTDLLPLPRNGTGTGRGDASSRV